MTIAAESPLAASLLPVSQHVPVVRARGCSRQPFSFLRMLHVHAFRALALNIRRREYGGQRDVPSHFVHLSTDLRPNAVQRRTGLPIR